MAHIERINIAKENHEIVQKNLNKVPITNKLYFGTHLPSNKDKNSIMLMDATTNGAAQFLLTKVIMRQY
jgi:methionyl-tRNA synthetase